MERDNGLEAKAFAFLGTADRAVADELLRELADEGIAAYAVPADPAERLYVDRTSLAYAQALLKHRLSDTDDADGASGDDGSSDDETWQLLVADFHRDADGEGDRPWPEAEDIDESDTATGDTDDTAKRTPRVSVVRLDHDDDAEPEPDEDHYIPPEPPQFTSGDPWIKFAWVAMLASACYLIAGMVLGWKMPGWAALLSAAGFIGGIVTHVIRIRDPREGDPPSDDGAVV
ncbi:MAG: hypothetical protein GEV10_20910 [Streptosporangiales bacterium]|nr:hypothetical protein [Streptosporangiales bacterium]